MLSSILGRSFHYQNFGTEGQRIVAKYIFDDSIQIMSTFEMNRFASLTYGDVVRDQMFDMLEEILKTPDDFSVLSIQKSLSLIKHVIIYGSEKCVNMAWNMTKVIEDLKFYNTAVRSQQTIIHQIMGGQVDRAFVIRELAIELHKLLQPTNIHEIQFLRQAHASENSLVPVGSLSTVGFAPTPTTAQQWLESQANNNNNKSNILKSDSSYGGGIHTTTNSSGTKVIAAAYTLEDMIQKAKDDEEKKRNKYFDNPQQKELQQNIYQPPPHEDLLDIQSFYKSTNNNHNNSLSNSNNNNNKNNTFEEDLLGFTTSNTFISEPKPTATVPFSSTGQGSKEVIGDLLLGDNFYTTASPYDNNANTNNNNTTNNSNSDLLMSTFAATSTNEWTMSAPSNNAVVNSKYITSQIMRRETPSSALISSMTALDLNFGVVAINKNPMENFNFGSTVTSTTFPPQPPITKLLPLPAPTLPPPPPPTGPPPPPPPEEMESSIENRNNNLASSSLSSSEPIQEWYLQQQQQLLRMQQQLLQLNSTNSGGANNNMQQELMKMIQQQQQQLTQMMTMTGTTTTNEIGSAHVMGGGSTEGNSSGNLFTFSNAR